MGQCLKFQSSTKPLSGLSCEEILENALREREDLLNRSPKLRVFQLEIDNLLVQAGCFENRMAVLGVMIDARFDALRQQIAYLLVLTRQMKVYTHQIY